MLNSFYWIIKNQLAGMAMPSASRAFLYLDDADSAARSEMIHEINELLQLGIGGVVTLTEEPLAANIFEQEGMKYLHIPVPDMTAPTQSQIREFIDFANSIITNGKAVVAHCLGGSGRTGTMLACYLIHQGYDAQSAIDAVRKVRPSAIETRWQEDAIIEYAHYLDNPGRNSDILL